MSSALLHALARPLSLRSGGVGRAARLALTLTSASRKRVLLNRMAPLEAMAVRGCSGPTTTFRQNTLTTGLEEEDSGKDVLAPHSLAKPQHVEPYDTAPSDTFLLPSQQERHQSDLLLAKIRECEDVTATFDVHSRHKEVMNTRHCLALIGRLSQLASTEDRTQILQDNTFKNLCEQLYAKCRRMEADESVQLLKYLSRLQVPSDSTLTQALLQMIRNQINDLPMKQLIFLEFLLRKMPLTPLSDALLTAIPLLLSNTLTTNEDLKDLSFNDLSQAFLICLYGRVGGVGTLLQEMYRRGSVDSASLAMSLVWTLTQMSSPALQRKLLTREEQLTRDVIMKECLETLAREVDSLSPNQVSSTLSKIYTGFSKGDRSCYNERFLSAAASYTCRHRLDFETAAFTVMKMSKMNYLSDELVRYTVQLILSHPEKLPESRAGMLPLIAQITATALPLDDVKAVLDVIITHKTLRMTSEYYKKPLLVVAVDLLSVGYYFPQLMEILTSPDTLSMFMSKYSKDDINQVKLLEVDQALGEVLQVPHRVPHAFLDHGRRLLASQSPTRSSLRAMLCQALEDKDQFISGVVTEAGLYIDHLLALDPAGVPIKFTGDEMPLERNKSVTSLNLPPDATKIAILDIGSSSVFRPASLLKGSCRLRLKVLEATGYRVLPMLQSVIFQHQDEEKILYVKRALTEMGVTLR